MTEREERARGLHGIYAIVDDREDGAGTLVRAVLEGGARIVQYRAKRGIDFTRARNMLAAAREWGALFIVNDDWRAAETLDDDGVHLGPGDARADEIAAIRAALPHRLIGVSCGTPKEARAAEEAGADYAGVGAVYATQSKADAGEPIGIAGLLRVAGATCVPVAAIGGIGFANLAEIRRAGVAMAAVISAIAASDDPRTATARLVAIWGGEGP